jgi:CBS domain containing-hemolysin-like protein
MALGVVGALLLVVANGFFVATEFAIARIRPTQVDELERARTPGARSLRHAVDHLDAYLAACQVGITVSTIGLGFVGKPTFEQLLHTAGVGSYVVSYVFAFGVVTLLHVVLGELAPKSLAIARNTRTALAIAVPMRAFYLATRPLVDLFNWMGNVVLKPFGIPRASEAGHAPHSSNELRLLLRQSLEQGLIEPAEQEYAENVLALGELRARQVMVPRPQVDFVTTSQGVRDAAQLATASGHTRLPLCDAEHGLDRPLGVVNAKDLLEAVLEGREPPLDELARPLTRVPESIALDELLAELRRERRHVALVADEHGTTIGLVTLEDVIEELVGEIEDEFDPGATPLLRRDGDEVIVDGAAPLNAVAAALSVEFTNPDEATIGGHVVELLGRLPERGESVVIDGHLAEVLEIDETRITELASRARRTSKRRHGFSHRPSGADPAEHGGSPRWSAPTTAGSLVATSRAPRGRRSGGCDEHAPCAIRRPRPSRRAHRRGHHELRQGRRLRARPRPRHGRRRHRHRHGLQQGHGVSVPSTRGEQRSQADHVARLRSRRGGDLLCARRRDARPLAHLDRFPSTSPSGRTHCACSGPAHDAAPRR